MNDPAESDASKLQWAYEFGAQNDQEGTDRHEYDGVTLSHQRLDANGTARADGQQTDKQMVSLRASKDQPNLFIEARAKTGNANIMEITKNSTTGTDYLIVDADGDRRSLTV